MKALVKNLISLILPITAVIIIPYALIGNAKLPILHDPSQWTKYQFTIGLVLFFVGLFLLIWTIRTFILIGKGTLAPWSPACKLIVSGVYAYVRNPMITGVLFILIGEALLFSAGRLIGWAIGFGLINHLYFVYFEEPGLLKRFGYPYQTYKKNVPRWIPRQKPWK